MSGDDEGFGAKKHHGKRAPPVRLVAELETTANLFNLSNLHVQSVQSSRHLEVGIHAKLSHAYPSRGSGDRRLHRVVHGMECPWHLGRTACIRSRIPRAVFIVNTFVFHFVADRTSSYERRDRILAVQAPVQLIAQVVAWLALYQLGFGLLMWPLIGGGGLGTAMEQAGSALCTLGYLVPHTSGVAALDAVVALAGLGTVALQIGYLPTLYAAFNRREALITMLDSRAGVPSWGPELLARTHYGLESGVSAVGELPELFEAWEQWSADVSESHTTYVPLIWFRSPRPLSSWVTAQLAVLDAAALYLALLPHAKGLIQARSVCGEASRASAISPALSGHLSRKTPSQATGSHSRMRTSLKRSSVCAESTFRSNVPSRMHGRTSWVGV